jgi:hypothetical protein
MCRIHLMLGYQQKAMIVHKERNPECADPSRSLKSLCYEAIRKCIAPTH